MSISSSAIGDAAISAQSGSAPAVVKTPPASRLVTAKADPTAAPEPR